MELRQYWHVIWKRVWIPILLVAVVAIVSLATQSRPAPTYTTQMRFTVSVEPPLIDERHYDVYIPAFVSSEYLVDDLTEILTSHDFANEVNTHLAEAGVAIAISKGVIAADREHRILTLNASWGNAAELQQIAQAIVTAVEEDSLKYNLQLSLLNASIKSIDEPSPPFAVPPPLTQRLDLPLRLILALVAGLALTFLIDYLDTSVRNAPELEAMGIPVLAEVPKQK